MGSGLRKCKEEGIEAYKLICFQLELSCSSCIQEAHHLYLPVFRTSCIKEYTIEGLSSFGVSMKSKNKKDFILHLLRS